MRIVTYKCDRCQKTMTGTSTQIVLDDLRHYKERMSENKAPNVSATLDLCSECYDLVVLLLQERP